MTAVRQDAWTPDDDLILAEVTLRHIREGGTQLAAFEEVGERIGRTAAACGFRWNSCVRKKYEAAIQIAKAQRQKRNKQKKSSSSLTGLQTVPAAYTTAQPSPYAHEHAQQEDHERTMLGESAYSSSQSEMIQEESLSMDAVIRFLKQFKGTYQASSKQYKQLEKELKEKDERLRELTTENEQLKKQFSEVRSDYQVVNDDYKALIQIMDRARKLAFLAQDEEEHKPRFKMDANGNLERID
ncbi:RsfA family transcriptional regulator [Marinicrinis sediminis]|uniref:RsfA family transcriptional regulator n=1 Tax=Marinicrinis sediminis TaxID=1652465 RepID=A0ABW5RCA5_9BACL